MNTTLLPVGNRALAYLARGGGRVVMSRRWASALLGRYTDQFPIELFRVNASSAVVLRDYEEQKKLNRTSYDLVTKDGKVLPKPGPNFEGPNGASLRPNSATLQEVVRNFRGPNVTIYKLAKGTPIPNNLVLLHEHSNHYSLQCKQEMTLEELNNVITKFCKDKGEVFTKNEWCEKYPFDPSMFEQ